MSIEFLKPGMQTSLQDSGFIGHMQQGISRAGAMDQLAMELANWLVSKPKDSAVLEVTLVGPTIKFSTAMQIAICGASFHCILNGIQIKNNETINIKAGDILEFNKLLNGTRAYLAFTGTIQQKKFLNSHSTNVSVGYGNNSGKSFKTGDCLRLKPTDAPPIKKLPVSLQLVYSSHVQLRVTEGIDLDCFSEKNVNLFYSQTYHVTTDSNRMGLRLKSQPLKFDSIQPITSSGINQGTIQIPANGQPIITSVEGQTIGGYPTIANIIQADLHLLGQLKANDRINFIQVDVIQAQKLWSQKVALFYLK
jgi:antagonist of KipI